LPPLSELLPLPQPPSLFESAQAPEPGSSKKRDTFEAYMGRDMRPLLQDVESRPEHYTTAQKEVVRRLVAGEPTRPGERAELLLQLTRRSEAQKTERTVRQRVTRTAIEPEYPPPAFEQQSEFKGAIRLI
jgi:hypothetical protein